MFPLKSTTKSRIKIIFKLLFFYFGISYFFILWNGLADPQSWYHPFFEQYNIIRWYHQMLLLPIKSTFNFFGATVYSTRVGLYWYGGHSVNLHYACQGFGIFAVLYALFLSFPGNKKIPFLLIGTVALYLLNILRIAAVFYLANTIRFSKYNDLSHDLFNGICYVLILLYFYYWYNREAEPLR